MSEPQEERKDRETGVTGRAAYNIVTDIVTGPNIRLKDNLVQGIAIFVCLCIGVGIGVALAREWLAGALVGGLVGLVLGLLGSGMFLMVYRTVRHIRGRHD